MDWWCGAGWNDVAVFDSTITGANPAWATNVLGADTAWGEIKILNPAVPIQISAGNTLTLDGIGLNSLGIDMSRAANALTLNCPVVLGASQTWLVAGGQKLNINGVVSGSSMLTINDGTAANGGTVFFGTQANTYTGGTLIEGGIVQLGNAASFGTGAITNNGGILRLPSTSALTITVPLDFTGTSTLDENLESANESLTGSWSGNGTIIITNMSTFGTHHNHGRRKLHRNDELFLRQDHRGAERSAAAAPRKAPCGSTPGLHRIILAAQT